MDVAQLFSQVKSLWPDVVDISLEGSNDNDTPFWSLIETYEAVADEISRDDAWLGLSAWAFHQSLVQIAQQAVSKGMRFLSTSEVPVALFDRLLRENLADSSWDEERFAYIRQNGPRPLGAIPALTEENDCS